ncbi:MAG: hypothetical protein FWF37_05085 [Chloroflexi bacterium]|nr:hypothetical protein [Chloroflexota bacterium]
MDFDSLDALSWVFLVLGIIFLAVMLVFGIFGLIHILRQKNKENAAQKEAAEVFFTTCPDCGTEVPLEHKRCPKCKAHLSSD